MSNNIAQRLGLSPRKVNSPTDELTEYSRNIGVEIEVEDVNPRQVQEELGGIWEITRDGSLRPPERSVELRSPVPGYSGKQLVDSIDALGRADSLANGSFGWRAAAHIHVDMRDKTMEDIHTTAVLYALIEAFIFAWDGTGRHESRFCMPWWVCSTDITTATKMYKTSDNGAFSSYIRTFSKYTALNLAPLSKFGTIEFRHAQSTKNRTQLLEYINIGLDICNASIKNPNTTPIQMVLDFMVDGPEVFIPRWFSTRSARALLRAPMGAMPLTQDILDRSISTALTLAELYEHKEFIIPKNIDYNLINSII